jgi:hypothetical protein
VELAVDPDLASVDYELEIDATPGPIRLSIGPARDPEAPDYTAFTVLALLRRRSARLQI